MNYFRRDGVYLRGSHTKNKKTGLFYSTEFDEYELHFILFFKNHELDIIELYTGIYIGEFVTLMKVFSSWTSIGHKMSKINSYSFDDNLVKYEIDINKKKIKVILTISSDGDRVLYKSDYLDDNKLDPLMYIFFPFPPYFNTFHEKDYYL